MYKIRGLSANWINLSVFQLFFFSGSDIIINFTKLFSYLLKIVKKFQCLIDIL